SPRKISPSARALIPPTSAESSAGCAIWESKTSPSWPKRWTSPRLNSAKEWTCEEEIQIPRQRTSAHSKASWQEKSEPTHVGCYDQRRPAALHCSGGL